MKQILREIQKEQGRKIIIPFAEDELFKPANERTEKYKQGAGVFPDRIIFQGMGTDTKDVINKIVEAALTDYAQQVARKIYPKQSQYHSQVVSFVKSHFQIDVVQMDLDDKPRPILQLSDYLNTAELQRRYPVIKYPHLLTFFSWVNKSFLVEDAWGTESHRFDTLLHIAAREFKDTEEYKASLGIQTSTTDESPKEELSPDEQDTVNESPQKDRDDASDKDLIKQLKKAYKEKKNGLRFRPVHKYIAIVYSDGDKVGEVIKSIEEEGKHTHAEFSRQMNAYALDSVQKVQEFGGMPVYAGGDDLLFFAPIVNGERNIFQFLKELDTLFQNAFKQFGKPVSQSFGLSMAYYKHPLSETLKSAETLLFQKAKSGNKNNIAFRLQKHSGSYVESLLHLKDKSTELFYELLNASLKNEGADLLRSVIYKLRESETLVGHIGHDPIKVGNYLSNSFNESIHKREPFKTFLENIGKLIINCYQEHSGDKSKAHSKLFSMLKTIAFLTQNEERE